MDNLGSQRPTTSEFGGEAIPVFNSEMTNKDIHAWYTKIDELRQIFKWSEDATIY